MSFKKLIAKIPGIENRNIRLYYLFSYIHDSFFTEGNWIFLYLIYFSYTDLGVLDAIALGLGMLMEIPSGAVGDLLGKKRTIQLSFFIVLISLIMMGLATSSTILFISNLLLFTGLALYSGTSEAFAYDSVISNGTKSTFAQVYSFSVSIKSIAFIIAAAIGAIAAQYNPRIPFLLWGFMFLIGTFASFWMTEPKIDSIKFTWKNYLQQTKAGFKQLLRPVLKPYLIFILVLLGVDYLYGWGFMKPAILLSFDYNALTMGIIFVLYGILSAITINYLPKLRKLINDFTAITIIGALMILCLLLFTTQNQIVAFFAAILMSLCGTYAYSWITIIINENIPSIYRATTISTMAMILKIPLILLSPFAGYIVDTGYLKTMLAAIAFIISISIIFTSLKNKNLLNKKRT